MDAVDNVPVLVDEKGLAVKEGKVLTIQLAEGAPLVAEVESVLAKDADTGSMDKTPNRDFFYLHGDFDNRRHLWCDKSKRLIDWTTA